MVDFLLQDGVSESLVAFITQVTDSQVTTSRPGPGDEQGDNTKLAYRCVYNNNNKNNK